MAKVRTPRTAWVDAALEALAEGGPEAVRVEVLATGLGVTKGGFYWHFTDRTALIAELLDTWEQRVVEDVITRLESEDVDARTKLQHLFELASERGMHRVELAVRDWARRDPDVAGRLHRVDTRRLDYLRSLFRSLGADDDEAEVRGLTTLALFVGSPLIRVEHPGRSRRQILKLATDRLLGPTPSVARVDPNHTRGEFE
jgi:AcrR family transcriptional regulator